MKSTTEAAPEQSARSLDRLVVDTDRRLGEANHYLGNLLVAVDALLSTHTDLGEYGQEVERPLLAILDQDVRVAEQLYDEASYNRYLKQLLETRGGGKEAFHNELVKFGADEKDSNEVLAFKAEVRQEILKAAQGLGFVPRTLPETPDSELMAHNMRECEWPEQKEFDYVDIPGAAGISNHVRLKYVIRGIEEGRIQTNSIVFNTCDRPLRADEKMKLGAFSYGVGENEADSCFSAAKDMGYPFEELPAQELPTPTIPNSSSNAHIQSGVLHIGDAPIKVVVISAPYNTKREIVPGHLAVRANSEETFEASRPFMSPGGSVLVVSHDTWIPAQGVIAKRIFSAHDGHRVTAAGPQNLNRVFVNEAGEIDLLQAEAVLDEMAKYFDELTKLRVALENERTAQEFIERVSRPIPDMSDLREGKAGYRDLPIVGSELSHEKLVNIADYDIAGQAYYSRPNTTTGEPIPGVDPNLQVRESLAQRLRFINGQLKKPGVAEFFGGEVELYVEDAVRTITTQTALFNEHIPSLLKRNNPDITEEELHARRSQIVAVPSADGSSPSPHATGGAIDVILRYKQADKRFVPGVKVPMGHIDGTTSRSIDPDYFEYHTPETPEDELAQRNRRAFYAIMTGQAFSVDTGLAVNPTEFWHWSIGDQLAAYVRGETAYYGLAE